MPGKQSTRIHSECDLGLLLGIAICQGHSFHPPKEKEITQRTQNSLLEKLPMIEKHYEKVQKYSLPWYFSCALADLVHWWGISIISTPMTGARVCGHPYFAGHLWQKYLATEHIQPFLAGLTEGKSVPSNPPHKRAGSKPDPPTGVLAQPLVVCHLQLRFPIAGVFHWKHNTTVH